MTTKPKLTISTMKHSTSTTSTTHYSTPRLPIKLLKLSATRKSWVKTFQPKSSTMIESRVDVRRNCERLRLMTRRLRGLGRRRRMLRLRGSWRRRSVMSSTCVGRGRGKSRQGHKGDGSQLIEDMGNRPEKNMSRVRNQKRDRAASMFVGIATQ